MTKLLKITLLLSLLLITGCGLQTASTPKTAPAEQTTADTAAIQQVATSDVAKWQTLTREDEGFTMSLPQKWWWQRDNDLQTLLDARFAAGFSADQEQWGQKNYVVIFFIANNIDTTRWNGYQKVITTKDDNQYVLRGAPEYTDIINAMAESFTFANEKIDMSDWQTYQNKKYGFELQCPIDTGYLSPEGGYFLGSLSTVDARETNTLILGKADESMIMSINSGVENKAMMTQELLSNKKLSNTSEVSVNGIKFEKYSLISGIFNGYNVVYIFEDNSRFIAIKFIDKPLANQIISTFRFTK